MQEKSTMVTTAIALDRAHQEAVMKITLEHYPDFKTLEQAALYLELEYCSPKSPARRKCPVCSRIFANYGNMQRHFQNKHINKKQK